MQRLEENGEWVLYPTNYEFEDCKSVSEYVEKEIINYIKLGQALPVFQDYVLFNLILRKCANGTVAVYLVADINGMLESKSIDIVCNYESLMQHIYFDEEKLVFNAIGNTSKATAYLYYNINDLVKSYLNNVSLATYFITPPDLEIRISFVNVKYYISFPYNAKNIRLVTYNISKKEIRITLSEKMKQIQKEMYEIMCTGDYEENKQKLLQSGLIDLIIVELMFIEEFAKVRKTGVRPAIKTLES